MRETCQVQRHQMSTPRVNQANEQFVSGAHNRGQRANGQVPPDPFLAAAPIKSLILGWLLDVDMKVLTEW